MRHLFYCDSVGRIGSVGLLLLRLVMGVAFMLHGWPKIQHPLNWMEHMAAVPAEHKVAVPAEHMAAAPAEQKVAVPAEHKVAVPAEHKVAVPAYLQALAALAEFGGGAALIVGLLTRLACLGIATNMIVALAMVHLPHGDPFVSKQGGPSFELAAVYLACAILFLVLGPGRFSLDARLFGAPPETTSPGQSG
jgi:putative oxidoreductase